MTAPSLGTDRPNINATLSSTASVNSDNPPLPSALTARGQEVCPHDKRVTGAQRQAPSDTFTLSIYLTLPSSLQSRTFILLSETE